CSSRKPTSNAPRPSSTPSAERSNGSEGRAARSTREVGAEAEAVAEGVEARGGTAPTEVVERPGDRGVEPKGGEALVEERLAAATRELAREAGGAAHLHVPAIGVVGDGLEGAVALEHRGRALGAPARDPREAVGAV